MHSRDEVGDRGVRAIEELRILAARREAEDFFAFLGATLLVAFHSPWWVTTLVAVFFGASLWARSRHMRNVIDSLEVEA